MENIGTARNMSTQDLLKAAKSPEFLSALEKVNRWDLLPMFFRMKGKPFSLKGREQFSVLFGGEMVRETIVMSGRQEGKCFQVSRNNLRDCYSRPLPNPSPGDSVLAFDGWKVVPGLITGVFHPGEKELLHITTETGNELYVSPDHKIRDLEGYVPAAELRPGDRIVSMRRGGVFGDFRPAPGRIEATAYMLGDGSTASLDMDFTSMCRFCLDEMERISGNGTWREERKRGSAACSVKFLRRSTIPAWMEEDGLLGKHSYDKHIPEWVFTLSRDDTILFISRLWATDGRVSVDRLGRADISYCTTSKELCNGVRALLFKLGYMNSVRTKPSFYRKSSGERVKCRDAYIVQVRTHESCMAFMSEVEVPGRPSATVRDTFRNNNRDTLPIECNELIKRLFASASYRKDGSSLYSNGLRTTLKYPLTKSKADKYLLHARSLGLSERPEYRQLQDMVHGDAYFDRIKGIEPAPAAECIDLEISCHHNFILDNVCVHNSASLSRSEIFNMMSIPEFQMLYVAPLQEQTRRYSDLYINEAIQSCPLAVRLQSKDLAGVLSDSKILTAVGHKTFANGSGLQLTYAKTSADRARGIMADMIDFDEIQDQSGEALPIIQESLTSSEYGVSRYTGTAKVVENLIEAKWQQSSMCEWVMHCTHCGWHNIPNMDGKVLQMIQADGMHCVKCGCKLDVTQGEWIAAYPKRMNSFRGYHIPQVICPFIVNNRNNWDKLLHKLMNGVLATFIQENLGISYSVGQRLLTQADITRQCCLPDMKTLQEEKDERYSFTVAGIDWGGAELQSFTVVTVIGIRHDGRIDVLWAKRYRGFDPDEQLTDIARTVRFYNCIAVAADLGMGMDKNLMLVRRFGLPVVQMMYTRQNKLFGKNSSGGATSRVQCWTIDKVMALDILFLAIRNGRIFFPKTGLEAFTPDLLSPYETTKEVGGMEHRLYLRSEGQPDDFCHALCFASMAGMRLMGLNVDDMIPDSAFGGGLVTGIPGANLVNPYEE